MARLLFATITCHHTLVVPHSLVLELTEFPLVTWILGMLRVSVSRMYRTQWLLLTNWTRSLCAFQKHLWTILNGWYPLTKHFYDLYFSFPVVNFPWITQKGQRSLPLAHPLFILLPVLSEAWIVDSEADLYELWSDLYSTSDTQRRRVCTAINALCATWQSSTCYIYKRTSLRLIDSSSLLSHHLMSHANSSAVVKWNVSVGFGKW
jgi:hypothetical protein